MKIHVASAAAAAAAAAAAGDSRGDLKSGLEFKSFQL